MGPTSAAITDAILWDASSLTTDLRGNTITNTSVAASTSVFTIGTQSAAIDANGKKLVWPSNSNFYPGTQDFFYGIWARWTRYGSGNPCYLAGFGDGSAANTQMIIVQHPGYYSTGVVLQTVDNVTSYATNFIPSENVWHHVALSRSGTTYRVFIDGVIRGTFTINGMNFQTPFRVGSGVPWWSDKAGQAHTNGYINSAQVVIGRPVVTSNFTITSPSYRVT